MKNISPFSGFSMVLGMGLALIMSFMGVYLISYMVPFSQSVKGIESASQSFYESYGGIEDALFLHSRNSIGYSTGNTISGTGQSYTYGVVGSGRFSPRQGVEEGTSEYDKNFNILSQSSPVQLLVGNNRLSGPGVSLRLYLKTPDFDRDGNQDLLDVSAPDGNSDIVLWQLSSTTQKISASTLIKESDINTGMSIYTTAKELMSTTENGKLLNGTASNFRNFYTSYCGVGNECVLKVTLIHPLKSTLSGNPIIPYLEYQIRAIPDIPLQAARVIVTGESYGFQKKYEVSVPQQTTNAAFDFTVFQ